MALPDTISIFSRNDNQTVKVHILLQKEFSRNFRKVSFLIKNIALFAITGNQVYGGVYDYGSDYSYDDFTNPFIDDDGNHLLCEDLMYAALMNNFVHVDEQSSDNEQTNTADMLEEAFDYV